MFQIRLKELREAKGYKSQKKFADAFGVAQPTVANWETGKREPNHATTERLAEFFGVTVDYLLGRTDNPEPAPDVPHEKYREVLAGPGLRLLLDADANLTEDQLKEIVDFIEFKRRNDNR